MAKILAHGIGGGGTDYRHEGCAGKCCEAEAIEHGHAPAGEVCGGCDAPLACPPARMDFDRDVKCESCACADSWRCADCARTLPDDAPTCATCERCAACCPRGAAGHGDDGTRTSAERDPYTLGRFTTSDGTAWKIGS